MVNFAFLFGSAVVSLLSDWWTNDEASHGLIIGPLALWLGWKARTGIAVPAAARARRRAGYACHRQQHSPRIEASRRSLALGFVQL